MKCKLVAMRFLMLCAAVTASFVSPAFASGYGPAPFYRPDVGSTSPHHAHWWKTSQATSSANGTNPTTDIGGVGAPAAQSGSNVPSPADLPGVPRQ